MFSPSFSLDSFDENAFDLGEASGLSFDADGFDQNSFSALAFLLNGDAETGNVGGISDGFEVGAAFSAFATSASSFTAGVGVSDSPWPAVANALAAIQHGLELGETWAALAAAEAEIVFAAEFEDSLQSDTETAFSAALSAHTEASAQFVDAVGGYAVLMGAASFSHAVTMVAAAIAQLGAGASLGAAFHGASSADVSIVDARASIRAIRLLATVRSIGD